MIKLFNAAFVGTGSYGSTTAAAEFSEDFVFCSL
ncbi:hypothetical protein ACVIHD_002689 [Bradyrhizobium embrapense]